MRKLHIDIETYSSVDLKTSGAYKYVESVDFEILIVCFAYDNGFVRSVELAIGEELPQHFLDAMMDPEVEKHAHNAVFERLCFEKIGIFVPIDQWHCSAIKAAYCGLPLSLGNISTALGLGDDGKSDTGKSLIRFFSVPIKPTKSNDFKHRNFPGDDADKWLEYVEYCKRDVIAERTIDNYLSEHTMPIFERDNYILDQKINDIGILIDVNMAKNAYKFDLRTKKILVAESKKITGLENPNSPKQLKEWLSDKLQKKVTTLAKDALPELLEDAGEGPVSDLINLRKKMSKSSVKKYTAMLNCVCEDQRAHGLFQFYGASRTGRWAGRLIQVQNLPRNYLTDLDEARALVCSGDYDWATIVYDDIPYILSQLIRTTFIAKPGHTFAVADFSSIEARVISWLANETWRLDVFKTHGKIYEAAASMMFNVPIEEIGKGSDMRSKGKIAELALGYQGAIGALRQMGGDGMGLSEAEMNDIVRIWRKANPMIVKFWKDAETCAIRSVSKRIKVISKMNGLVYECDGTVLTIELPAGKKLFYRNPRLSLNKWGKQSLSYMGMDQTTNTWCRIDTYGGKLVENIVQAIARDLLAHSMLEIDKLGIQIVMHVHDEAVCEIKDDDTTQENFKLICDTMGLEVSWAKGLPLNADGYLTKFYKKD